MVARQKAFSLISSWDHCQRSTPSQIFDMSWAEFEPVQNLSCAVAITTTPQYHSHESGPQIRPSGIILGLKH